MVTFAITFWDCVIGIAALCNVHAHIQDTGVVIFLWIIECHIVYVIPMHLGRGLYAVQLAVRFW